jgi:hypothetical protein
MKLPELVPISYRGELVATVSRERIHILAPWLIGRPAGDPDLRFVAMMCACAGEVLAGNLAGPYTDALAEEWARGALAGEAPSITTA